MRATIHVDFRRCTKVRKSLWRGLCLNFMPEDRCCALNRQTCQAYRRTLPADCHA